MVKAEGLSSLDYFRERRATEVRAPGFQTVLRKSPRRFELSWRPRNSPIQTLGIGTSGAAENHRDSFRSRPHRKWLGPLDQRLSNADDHYATRNMSSRNEPTLELREVEVTPRKRSVNMPCHDVDLESNSL